MYDDFEPTPMNAPAPPPPPPYAQPASKAKSQAEQQAALNEAGGIDSAWGDFVWATRSIIALVLGFGSVCLGVVGLTRYPRDTRSVWSPSCWALPCA